MKCLDCEWNSTHTKQVAFCPVCGGDNVTKIAKS